MGRKRSRKNKSSPQTKKPPSCPQSPPTVGPAGDGSIPPELLEASRDLLNHLGEETFSRLMRDFNNSELFNEAVRKMRENTLGKQEQTDAENDHVEDESCGEEELYEGHWITTRDERCPRYAVQMKYTGEVIHETKDACKVYMTRRKILEYIYLPFFDTLMPGCLVTVFYGGFRPRPIQYAICEITEVMRYDKVYKVDDGYTDKCLRVKYGEAYFEFPLNYLTNLELTDVLMQQYLDREGRTRTILSQEYVTHKDKRLWLASEHTFTLDENEGICELVSEYNSIPGRVDGEKQPSTGPRILCPYCVGPGPSNARECRGTDLHDVDEEDAIEGDDV